MNSKTFAIVLGLALIAGLAVLFLSADTEPQPSADTSVATSTAQGQVTNDAEPEESKSMEYDFSFSASPLNASGESMLTWNAPEGSVCILREGTLNGEYFGLDGNLSAAGTYTVKPDAIQIYSMICTPAGGSVPDMRGKEVTVYRN